MKLSEIYRNIENKRAEMVYLPLTPSDALQARSIGDDLITSLQKSVNPDKVELDVSGCFFFI